MAIIDPTGLTDQQKSSLASTYKTQGQDAAQKAAEMMRQYNADKPSSGGPLSSPTPKSSIISGDPLTSGAKSQGTALNMDKINDYRAQSGLSPIADVYSTTGQKYAESASGSKLTNDMFAGDQAAPYYGNKPGVITESSLGADNPYEQALKEERRARQQAQMAQQAAQAEAENIRNLSAQSQKEAGVVPTTPGTVPTSQTSQNSGFGAYVGGLSDNKEQYFQSSGVNDQIKALDAEKNRLQSLLSGNTLSDSQKSVIQAQYDAANKQLENAKNEQINSVDRAKEEARIQYDAAIEKQKVTNAQMLESAQKMAALTGASFSTGGMTGLDSVLQQGQSQINELEARKANLMAQYQDKHDSIVADYQAKVQQNLASMNADITNKYNDTVAAINKIDAEKGKVTKEWFADLKALAKDYGEFVDKAADRAFKQNQQAWEQAKFAVEMNFKQDEAERKQYSDLFQSAFAKGNLYGMPTSYVDSLNMPEEMKTLLKGGIVRDTVTALNEYGKSVGYGDIGTRYADQIRKGIAGGMSSAEIVSSLSKELNLPLEKATESKIGWQNVGQGKLVKTNPDGSYEIIDANQKVSQVNSGWLLSSLGSGKVTGYGGAYDGYKGLDVDGQKGDPVMGIAGTVVSVIDASNQSSPFGNSVVIQDADGNQIRLSHLDSLNVQPGQQVSASDLIGTLGNTGNVVAGPGGDGSHLDVRVKAAGANSEMSSHQVEQFLRTYGRGTTQSGGTGVMTNYGVPLEYDRRIKSLVPTQLMNSDKEREALESNIKSLSDAGVPAEDAVLAYMGMSVPKAQKAKALELVQISRGLGEDLNPSFYTTVSDYLNRGDQKGAEDFVLRKVDSVVKKNEGAEAISTPQLRFAGETMAKLNSFIDRNSSKIGPLAGRFSDARKQFMNDPDYQALSTLLTGSLAEVRKTFAGSAVTESELKALRDFIGVDTKMPIENLKSALETNFEQTKAKYDAQRSFLGVPDEFGSRDQYGNQPQAAQPAPDEYDSWLSGGSSSSGGAPASSINNPFAR